MRWPPPRSVLDDACLRCSRLFEPHEVTCIVHGGRHAKYRDIALVVCASCRSNRDLDVLIGQTVYVPAAHGPRRRTWPRYVGTTGIAGMLKLSRLENGVYRVGLHRGHAEVWPYELVRRLGASAPLGAYSHDYQCYGSPKLLPDGFSVVERRFVDCAEPASFERVTPD